MTKFTPAIYGAAPVDLGLVDLDVSEMMFWLYCPIKIPGAIAEHYPDQLEKYVHLINAVYDDVCKTYGIGRWRSSYVYLSAKVTHVTPDAPGNRPGWHSDGFLTDDLNYIWADRNPTEFFVRDDLMTTYSDHAQSMRHFESHIQWGIERLGYQTEHAKVNHLYRLDQTNIHRVSKNVESGKRAFLKVSISDKPYVQLGNSINHHPLLSDHPRPTVERQAERNCPQAA
jgi:hypothetical protein